MSDPMDLAQIPSDLGLVERVFPELANGLAIEQADIATYYDRSFWGYSLLHSRDGAVHLSLSRDGGISREDFLQQAREVAEIAAGLPPDLPQSILEVGCGRGFNLAHLARRFPDHTCRGIDYSPRHVRASQKTLASVPNATAEFGDFHKLDQFDNGQFSLVYGVETLCHALDFAAVLAALRRVLTDGGCLVVFDGFREDIGPVSPDLAKAMRYTEAAMAVPRFADQREFAGIARDSGFDILENTDRTADVLPNAERLARRARRFFDRPALSRAVRLLAPRELTRNAVAGLLMARTMSIRAHSYRRFVLRAVS